MSLLQDVTVVVCRDACLSHKYCEQPNRVFSCRLHSLLMFTRVQDASQQQSGKLRWTSAAIASAPQTDRYATVDGRVSVCDIRQKEHHSLHLFSVTRRFWHSSLSGESGEHFSFLILCVWACFHLSLWETLYPHRDSFRRRGRSEHTLPNLHAPRSRENGCT